MCFCRGDSTYISLYFPGVYVAQSGTNLTCSNDFNVAIGSSTFTISPSTIVQRYWGIQVVCTCSGYGSTGVAIIKTDVTFSC